MDVLSKAWIPGPELNTARSYHSCGVIRSKSDPLNGSSDEDVLVVAGGIDDNGYTLSSVELLLLKHMTGGKSVWKPGPELPKKIRGSAMVEFRNGVVLVGGAGDDFDGKRMFRLTSANGSWIQMEQSLKESRLRHVAFFIPDQMTSCKGKIFNL